MNDIELRLECIRIASDNLQSLDRPFTESEVLEHAGRLFDYIWKGYVLKAA